MDGCPDQKTKRHLFIAIVGDNNNIYFVHANNTFEICYLTLVNNLLVRVLTTYFNHSQNRELLDSMEKDRDPSKGRDNDPKVARQISRPSFYSHYFK